MGRSVIHDDSALIDKNDPVDVPVQDVFNSVLDYYHSLSGLLVQIIDKLDGKLACRGIKCGKRLIKKQDGNIIHKHAGKRNSLFLSSGEVFGTVVEKVLH